MGVFQESFALMLITTCFVKNANGKISLTSVCYENLGCFEPMNLSTWGFPFIVPDSPKELETQFFLTTRKSINKPIVLSYSNSKSFHKMDCKKRTIFVVHGWTQNSTYAMYEKFREAIFHMFDYNIISVDWKKGAASELYIPAAVNTQIVGRQIAHLIQVMIKVCGLSVKDVHLIGQSLGAHVSGFAGSWAQSILKQKLYRITGAEPASILFVGATPDARLDKSDAEFVDVVHTTNTLGSLVPSGHVDFYVNGAVSQPACNGTDLTEREFCSHNLAFAYITESVYDNCKFTSHPCARLVIEVPILQNILSRLCPCNENCGRMGYYSDIAPGRNMQYLNTGKTSPYCIS